jgi:hypothetical protein
VYILGTFVKNKMAVALVSVSVFYFIVLHVCFCASTMLIYYFVSLFFYCVI